jgi:rhodanese-related sulfurtransferase
VDATELPSDAVLLDVREDDEWAAGHIDGAVHVPMMQLPQRLNYEPGPITPDRPVVVVCKVGSRSAQVTAWLRHQGYDAVNLAGGLLAWEASGRPLATEGDAPGFVL